MCLSKSCSSNSMPQVCAEICPIVWTSIHPLQTQCWTIRKRDQEYQHTPGGAMENGQLKFSHACLSGNVKLFSLIKGTTRLALSLGWIEIKLQCCHEASYPQNCATFKEPDLWCVSNAKAVHFLKKSSVKCEKHIHLLYEFCCKVSENHTLSGCCAHFLLSSKIHV